MNDRVFADSSLVDDIASPVRQSSASRANHDHHSSNGPSRAQQEGQHHSMRPMYRSPPQHPPFAATAPPDESDEDDVAAASHSRAAQPVSQGRRGVAVLLGPQQPTRSHYKSREEAAAGNSGSNSNNHRTAHSNSVLRDDDPATVVAGGNDAASRGSSATSSTQTTPLVKEHRSHTHNNNNTNSNSKGHASAITNTVVHSYDAWPLRSGREDSVHGAAAPGRRSTSAAAFSSALALPQSSHVDPQRGEGGAATTTTVTVAEELLQGDARQRRHAASAAPMPSSSSYTPRDHLEQQQQQQLHGHAIADTQNEMGEDEDAGCIDDDDEEEDIDYNNGDGITNINEEDDVNDEEATQAMRARPPALAALPPAALDKNVPVKPMPIDPFYYHVVAVVNPGSGTNVTATFIYQVLLALLGSSRVRLMKKADFADPRELRAMIRDYGVIYHPNSGPSRPAYRAPQKAHSGGNGGTAAAASARSSKNHPPSTNRANAEEEEEGNNNNKNKNSNNTIAGGTMASATMTVSEEHERHTKGGGNHSRSSSRPRPRGTIFVAGGDGTVSFILSQLDAVREELEVKYRHIGSPASRRQRQRRPGGNTVASTLGVASPPPQHMLPPREGSVSALRSPSNVYGSPHGASTGPRHSDSCRPLSSSASHAQAGEGVRGPDEHMRPEEEEEEESVSSGQASLQGSVFCYDSDVERAHGLRLGDEDARNALLYTLPAVAPVPLGTGNDFSNCLGFGDGFVQGSCPRCCSCCKRCCAHCCGCCKEVASLVELLDNTLESPCVPFDRWAADMIPLRVAQDYFDPGKLGMKAPATAAAAASSSAFTSASTNLVVASERSNYTGAGSHTEEAAAAGRESTVWSDPSAPRPLMDASLAKLRKLPPAAPRPPDLPVANLVNGVNWDAIRHDRQCITQSVMNYLSVGYDAYITCRFDKIRREHPNLCATRLQNKALYGLCGLVAAARCQPLQKLLPMVVIPSPWPAAAGHRGRMPNYQSTMNNNDSNNNDNNGDGNDDEAGSVAKSDNPDEEEAAPAAAHTGGEEGKGGEAGGANGAAVPASQRTARRLHAELERPRRNKARNNNNGDDEDYDDDERCMSSHMRDMLGLQLPSESKVLLMTNISRYAAGTAPWEPISRAPRYTAIDLDAQHHKLVVNTDVVQKNSIASPVAINDRHFEVQSMGGVCNYGTMRMGLSHANKITQTDEMFIFVLCTPDDLRFPRTAFSPYTKAHLRKYIYAMQDDSGLRASLNMQIDGEAMPRVAEPTIIRIRPYTTHRVRVRCRNMAVVKRTLITDDLAFISREV